MSYTTIYWALTIAEPALAVLLRLDARFSGRLEPALELEPSTIVS